jgi:hypothetical protein
MQVWLHMRGERKQGVVGGDAIHPSLDGTELKLKKIPLVGDIICRVRIVLPVCTPRLLLVMSVMRLSEGQPTAASTMTSTVGRVHVGEKKDRVKKTRNRHCLFIERERERA